MSEVWLKSNRRALALGMILPGLMLLIGLVLLAAFESLAARVTGGLIGLGSLAMIVLLAWQMRQPRLAYKEGHLLIYLRGMQPTRVPLEVVECFLLGQAPTLLPGRQHQQTEAASVVIRLSETAPQWKQRDVKTSLGKWCESYITLRGTWCEPLDLGVVNRLNARLAEAQHSLKQAKVSA